MGQVNEILLKLERMDEKLVGYPALQSKVESIDKGFCEQVQKCNYIQQSKVKISWGQLLTQIMGWAAIGVIAFLVGYAVNH